MCNMVTNKCVVANLEAKKTGSRAMTLEATTTKHLAAVLSIVCESKFH